MRESELKLLQTLRTISRYSIATGILVSLAFTSQGTFPMEWQAFLALIALAVGIPHGAVDHLVTVPKFSKPKMSLFLFSYLAAVGIVILFILQQNILGFQIVVVMSAVHFGIGDAAFISEIDRRSKNGTRIPKFIHALAAGSIPVLIPLVNNQSAKALQRVNPNLVNWVGDLAPALFITMLALAASALLVMAIARRWQEAIDIALLTALALVAPPLVAFAFYFGLWHALRHTGRLTLELQSAQKMHQLERTFKAFAKAFLAGIPALVITLTFTLILGLTNGFEFSQDFLWYLLVVVWALTVPHMILTAKLDAKAFS